MQLNIWNCSMNQTNYLNGIFMQNYLKIIEIVVLDRLFE